MIKRGSAIILLSLLCLLCSCGGIEEPEIYGGEFFVFGTVTKLDTPYILLEVTEDTPHLKEGETVALSAADMERENPERFTALQEGDAIAAIYLRISEEGPPPVLFSVSWGMAEDSVTEEDMEE